MISSGFYSTIILCTSHLFHMRKLSLYLPIWVQTRIKNLRILNEILLENIPMLIIQLYIINNFDNNNSNGTGYLQALTTAAFFSIVSSVISIAIGCLTIVSSFVHYCCTKLKEKQGRNLAEYARTAIAVDDGTIEVHLIMIIKSSQVKKMHMLVIN